MGLRFKGSALIRSVILLLLVSSVSCINREDDQPIGHGGTVIAIKDGDTIEILTRDKFTISIRLDEIDCPEKKQAYGQAAKKFTSDFCFGKYVTVTGSKKDGYGRLLCHVFNEKGENLNKKLLINGLAWQYLQYSSSAELAALQRTAKLNKKGLWAEPNPVAPWLFRKKKAAVK